MFGSPMLLAPAAEEAAWAPTDITSAKLIYEADAGITLSGSDVAAWLDQASSKSAANASNRPEYVTNAINGNPVVRGDGSEYLTCASGTGASGNKLTWCWLVKVSNWSANGCVFQFGDAGARSCIWGGPFFFVFPSGDYYNKTITETSDPFIVTFVYDYTQSTDAERARLYIDGALQTADSITGVDSSMSDVSYFDIMDFAGNEFVGDMAFFGLFQDAISPTDRGLLHNYLGTKYNISVS